MIKKAIKKAIGESICLGPIAFLFTAIVYLLLYRIRRKLLSFPGFYDIVYLASV